MFHILRWHEEGHLITTSFDFIELSEFNNFESNRQTFLPILGIIYA